MTDRKFITEILILLTFGAGLFAAWLLIAWR